MWATGLTTIQGCGFDSWGNFYATEFQVNGLNPSPTVNPLGAVVMIAPNGTEPLWAWAACSSPPASRR